MTMIIRLSERRRKVAYSGEDEVSDARSESNGKEQPDIERHGNQHEDVGRADL